jgi:hypothetical protein
MARQIFSCFCRRASAGDYEGCLTITVKGQPQPAPHGLRPIHFINSGGFTSAGISLQVANHYKIVMFSKTNFQGNQHAVEPLALLFRSVALVPQAHFATELLREIRSVSRALAVKLEP